MTISDKILWNLKHEPATVKVLVVKVGASSETIQQAIRGLVKSGQVKIDGIIPCKRFRGRNERIYSLRQPLERIHNTDPLIAALFGVRK